MLLRNHSSSLSPPGIPPSSMKLLHSASPLTLTLNPFSKRQFSSARSCLPFSNQKAKYHRELQVAVDVVERACLLCVDVKRSIFSIDGRILEKNDHTPVTIADFGVQALLSLELAKMFPSIPLVAEEDSDFLRSNNLVDSVASVVSDRAIMGTEPLTHSDVLEAIDRGVKHDFAPGAKEGAYWVLDPIDGTKGFLKGNDALYVVGLALIVEGEVVLGVMGCPNWHEDKESPGVIMVSHVGCGTWTKRLAHIGISAKLPEYWTRRFVDGCQMVHEARFCIPESQTWESLSLSTMFTTRIDDGSSSGDGKEILLLPVCCGSLCKYLMVASGKASVFILRVRDQKLIKAWDHAGGVICVHEAGGKVTDWSGSELDFTADKHERRTIFPCGGIIVSNGNIHCQVMDMVCSV